MTTRKQVPIESPLTPVYPFNKPGDAIDLYAGPIGGLYPTVSDGNIQLVPYPAPQLRWQLDVPKQGGHWGIGQLGTEFDLEAAGMTGRSLVTHASIGSAAGTSASLESAPDEPMTRVLVHWMNLPRYAGNVALRFTDSQGRTWSRLSRLALRVGDWVITLDERPDIDSVFDDHIRFAPYFFTHVMELRRSDGASFDARAAVRLIDAICISLSFAAGRWVAPPLSVGFAAADRKVWHWWYSPICAPYEKTGSPVISPAKVDDLEAFLEASIKSLHKGSAKNTSRFQMMLATQTASLGFVENRIFSTFPAIENLSWEIFVIAGRVNKKEFENPKKWPTARRLRDALSLAKIPTNVDPTRLPALHKLTIDKGMDGPEAVTWVRNRLVHPKTPHDHLYSRDSMLTESWLQSREYICLLLLWAIGYTRNYLSVIPPYGSVRDTAPVPWAAP